MNNIEAINLKDIEKLIPGSLMNKFRSIQLKTVGEVMTINMNQFKQLPSVGQKTIERLQNFQLLIKSNPDKIHSIVMQDTETVIKINPSIKNIPLKYLKEIIPTKLINKFYLAGILKIGDIESITIKSFRKLPSVGNSTIAELKKFLKFIETNPGIIRSTYFSNKEKMLPQSINMNSNFAEILQDMIKQYFSFINPKVQNIFFKRFGFENSKIYTLEEIGLFYDLTRERIRQIKEKHLEKIKKLLEGKVLEKPFVQARKEVVDTFKEIKQRLNEKTIISRENTIKYLSSQFKIATDSISDSFLLLLTELLKGVNGTFQNTEYYIFSTELNKENFEKISKQIIYILQKKVEPTPFFDLVIEVKKGKELPPKEYRKYIEYALKIFDFIIEKNIDGQRFIQLRFDMLSSIKDYAHRILYEKQKPLHYKEIWREICHRLVNQQNIQEGSIRSLNGQMVADERFMSIGKTGFWGLTIWGNDNSSIWELIQKALYFYNKPCSIKEISNFILKKQPRIKEHSIYSIISQKKDFIVKDNNNNYTLVSWITSGKTARTPKRKVIPMDKLCEIVIQIFKEKNRKLIYLKEIKQYLKEKGIEWGSSTYYARLNLCPVIETIILNNEAYYKILDDAEIKIKKIKKESKKDILCQAVVNLFKATERDHLLLSTIVNSLSNRGFIRSNIYMVIASCPAIFLKSKDKNNNIVITLKQISEDTRNPALAPGYPGAE